MLKTRKQFPKNLAGNPVVIAMKDAAVNVHAANMNVLYVARDQGIKVWGALGATAGDLAAQNLRSLKDAVAAANDRSVAAWNTVEQVLDAQVMPMLDKVGLASPVQYGVDLFGKGLHRVSAQVVELTREPRVAAKRAARKPATKKPAARGRARPAVKLAA